MREPALLKLHQLSFLVNRFRAVIKVAPPLFSQNFYGATSVQ